MNVLSLEKQNTVREMLTAGVSSRKIAASIPCARQTVVGYMRLWKIAPLPSRCKHCGSPMPRLNSGRRVRKFCKQSCAQRWIAISRRRISKAKEDIAATLYRLYWVDGKTTPEIAAIYKYSSHTCVRRWMQQLDIPRRRSGPRKVDQCEIDGCDAPVFRIVHTNNGSPYGRKCRAHREAHRQFLASDYRQRKVSQGTERLMSQVATLLAGLPEVVRDDAEQEIVLAALSGELALPLTKASVRPYIKDVFRENADAWKFVSLAAPVAAGDDVQTWGERLGIS